jgi:hypothetical protein
MNKQKKSMGALKMLYIRKKNYYKRGYWHRINSFLGKILKTKGYDAWLEATKTI